MIGKKDLLFFSPIHRAEILLKLSVSIFSWIGGSTTANFVKSVTNIYNHKNKVRDDINKESQNINHKQLNNSAIYVYCSKKDLITILYISYVKASILLIKLRIFYSLGP